MALIWNDRVLETSTTTGTGAFALDAAVTGYQRFSAAMSVADTCYYFIEAVDANGNPSGDWETGLGTYSSANTLTRTTPQQSSNADAAVNFAAGSKRIALTPTAAYFNTVATATPFIQTLLDDADAATARATLGVASTTFASAAEIRTGTEAAKAVAPDQLKLGRYQEWAPNFTAAGDLYIPAYVAMTISQGNAKLGTGTLTYTKSTNAAPSTFGAATLPVTLEAGAWLKVAATAVTGFVATHLVRTA